LSYAPASECSLQNVAGKIRSSFRVRIHRAGERKEPTSIRQGNLPDKFEQIRAADAKEVGVGNPAEETYCYPNKITLWTERVIVNRD